MILHKQKEYIVQIKNLVQVKNFLLSRQSNARTILERN